MPKLPKHTYNWKVHTALTDCLESSEDAMILKGQEKKDSLSEKMVTAISSVTE